MTIWDLICDEIREGNSDNLLGVYQNIHKNWRRGFISDIQAQILCEREYDVTHNIYK